MTKEQQILAADMIVDAILEAIKAGGSQGAPAGVMYAALMGFMSLEQFEDIMTALVRTGKVRKQGHLYFYARGRR